MSLLVQTNPVSTAPIIAVPTLPQTAEKVDRVFRGISLAPKVGSSITTFSTQIGVVDLSATLRGLGDEMGLASPFPIIPEPLGASVGLSTAVCAVVGPLMVVDAVASVKAAQSYQDKKGVVLGLVNGVRGTSLTLGGAAFGVLRAFQIAVFYTRGGAKTVWERAAYCAAAIGECGFGILYLCGVCMSIYRMIETVKMRQGLTKEKLQERLDALKDNTLLEVTDVELEALFKVRASAWLRGRIGEASISEEEIWEFLGNNASIIREELYLEWPEIAGQLLQRYSDPRLALAHALKIDIEHLKKRADLDAIFTHDTVSSFIENGIDLEKAKAILNRSSILNLLNLVNSLLGIVWVVLSFKMPVLGALLYVIQQAICCPFDLKEIKNWITTQKINKNDMRVAMVSIVLAVVSVALTIMLASHFGLPFIVIFSALTMNAIWIGTNLFVLYKGVHADTDHPTLETFSKFMETCIDQRRAQEVFNRLSQQDREVVEKEIKIWRKYHRFEKGPLTPLALRNGVSEVLEKRSLQKQRELEFLRTYLLPLAS